MRGRDWGERGVFTLTALALLAALGVLIWPLIAAANPSGRDAIDPATVSDFTAVMKVDRDGTLHATETVTVDLPAGRHGIFRYWDLADGADPRGRAVPKDIEIKQDGHPAEVQWLWESGRRFKVAKIGDAGEVMTAGQHVWTFSYVVDGVLAEPGARNRGGSWASDGGSEFVWDVVPWSSMPIAKSKVTVHLPAAAREGARCAAGLGVPCEIAADGSTVTVTTGQLYAHQQVSVAARLGVEPSPGTLLPWPAWLDPVLGRNVLVAIVLAGAALVAFVVGRLLERRTRERSPGFPVLFEPPAGLGPVSAAYISREQLPKNALSATLLYLAERGLVKVDHQGQNQWTVTTLEGGDWSKVDHLSQFVGAQLGLTTPGATFAVDGSVASGQDLSSLMTALPGEARAWAVDQGLLVKSPMVPGGRAALVVAALLTALLAWAQPFGIGLIAFVPAAFVVGGIGLLRAAATTHRTAEGRDAWSRAGGFRRMLATDSAEARFDFSARKDLYTSYIPYAVAFGCAEAWARKYQAATGEPAPVPLWYAGGMTGSGYGGGFGTLSFDSFDAALGSSISAYAATQRPSSSSGGGGGGFSFSGGGGGGGGGMGSW